MVCKLFFILFVNDQKFFFAGVAAAACYPCEQLFGLTACAAAGISESFSYFLRELNFSSSSPSSWGFFLLLPAAKTRTIVKSSRWAADSDPDQRPQAAVTLAAGGQTRTILRDIAAAGSRSRSRTPIISVLRWEFQGNAGRLTPVLGLFPRIYQFLATIDYLNPNIFCWSDVTHPTLG